MKNGLHFVVQYLLLVISYLLNLPGDYGGGVTPVPFPNTEVKPSSADDTAFLKGGKVGRCQAFFCKKNIVFWT